MQGMGGLKDIFHCHILPSPGKWWQYTFNAAKILLTALVDFDIFKVTLQYHYIWEKGYIKT